MQAATATHPSTCCTTVSTYKPMVQEPSGRAGRVGQVLLLLDLLLEILDLAVHNTSMQDL